MSNKDHVYMKPVPTKDKDTIIRALKKHYRQNRKQ